MGCLEMDGTERPAFWLAAAAVRIETAPEPRNSAGEMMDAERHDGFASSLSRQSLDHGHGIEARPTQSRFRFMQTQRVLLGGADQVLHLGMAEQATTS